MLMKRPFFGIFLILAVLLALPAKPAAAFASTGIGAGADDEILLSSDGWSYVGHLHSGITFAIPSDSYQGELNESDMRQGMCLHLWNDDYTLVLKCFGHGTEDYEAFKKTILADKTADTAVRDREGTEIFIYRNTTPAAVTELYGIALIGLDGELYKISVFTGDSEKYGPEDPVWEIADTIGKTVRLQDFSEWGYDAPGQTGS